MLDRRTGIDLSQRGHEDLVRPCLIFLERDYPVVAGGVIKSGEDKIQFNFAEIGQSPKGEVGNLMDWPMLIAIPSTGRVIPANRYVVQVEGASKVTNRGTASFPCDTLPSNSQTRGKPPSAIDVEPDFKVFGIPYIIRLKIKLDRRNGSRRLPGRCRRTT